jgi:hypothetical protein
VVERQLPMLNVVGSSPISRFECDLFVLNRIVRKLNDRHRRSVSYEVSNFRVVGNARRLTTSGIPYTN